MPGQEKGQTGPAAPKPKEVKTDYSEPKPEAEVKKSRLHLRIQKKKSMKIRKRS